MKEIYEALLRMQSAQEAEAGPFFAEMCNPEAWRELLRHIIANDDDDFVAQMTEAAALAIWALKTARESEELDAALENAFAVEPDSTLAPEPEPSRFGPIDQAIRLSRSRRLYE